MCIPLYTWHQFPCVRPPDRPLIMRPLTYSTARGPVDNFTLALLIYIYRPSLALRAADASCTRENPLLSVRRLATGLFGCLDTRVLARSACPAHYLTPSAHSSHLANNSPPPARRRFLLDLCSTSSHSKAGDAVCPSPSTHWERSLRHNARRTRLCECREVYVSPLLDGAAYISTFACAAAPALSFLELVVSHAPGITHSFRTDLHRAPSRSRLFTRRASPSPPLRALMSTRALQPRKSTKT